MKDFSTQFPGRECKVFWVAHEFDVYHVQGFACGPGMPGMWWCPEIGNSVSDKFHAFDDELSAWSQVLKEVEEQQRMFGDRLLRIMENILRLNVGLPSRTFGGTEKERSEP